RGAKEPRAGPPCRPHRWPPAGRWCPAPPPLAPNSTQARQRTPTLTNATSRHGRVDAIPTCSLAPLAGRGRAGGMRSNDTTRLLDSLCCQLTRSLPRYRNLADVLRHFVALLNRRPFGNARVPPRHVGILLEIDGLPLVARDPRPDGDIRDGIIVGDEFAPCQPRVEHAIEPPGCRATSLVGAVRPA